MFFLLSILLKNDNSFSKTYEIIFKKQIDFSYIRSKTNYLLGKFIYKKESYVSSEKLIYENITKKDNKYYLKVSTNYVINNLCKGVLVYKNKTKLIVECDDTNTIYYENLENINVNLYDYIDKGVI